MSKAQVRVMDEHAPAYLAWVEALGHAVGIKVQPWQRRTIEAMIRSGFLTEDGQVTEGGKQAWIRAITRRDRLENLLDLLLECK
ncbi:hypothetical protein [Bradyrhizobium erythrophlei]|uniref:Uncharacterized protein n=1 Tax=Bradyrhizobium erythrophlei TaxID=1437360 RepID=A0A1M5PNR3_9BRAD|nr:hypothetical protein [Bradyrhizobium erythrophlei]SHH03348.1 hypothetical protein SAMN05443248_3445 [Bradyrhizobium erythrophlei]